MGDTHFGKAFCMVTVTAIHMIRKDVLYAKKFTICAVLLALFLGSPRAWMLFGTASDGKLGGA